MDIIEGSIEAIEHARHSDDASTVYMSGQSWATAIIASVVLIESIVAAIVVCKNIKIRFSFKIIGLVALGCLSTLAFQILQERSAQNSFTVIGQGISIFFMEIFIPMSIIFTKR